MWGGGEGGGSEALCGAAGVGFGETRPYGGAPGSAVLGGLSVPRGGWDPTLKLLTDFRGKLLRCNLRAIEL